MLSRHIALLAVLLTVGCGKDETRPVETKGTATPSPSPSPTELAPPVAPKPTASEAPRAPGPKVDLQLGTVANTMAFDKTKLTVPTGAEVHLTLKNNATMATLPHNWVLVKPGTEASVAAAGLKLGEPAGYFDGRDRDALAHTSMAKPGETAEVTFTAPAPGDYPYICTFPGHYMMMKGVLTVTP